MYAPVGHENLRASLRLQTASFALLGPPGVGKTGIVTEWLRSTPHQTWTPDERLDGAAAQRDLVRLIDASEVRTWTPLLRPLEDATLRVVVIGEHDLPTAITSRLPVYRAGLLTEIEVTQILARDHPRLSPRPLIARLAQGSLADLPHLVAVATALPDVEAHLSARTRPDPRRTDATVLLGALHAVCRAVLGLIAPPISEAARAIPRRLALDLLNGPSPTSKHEARTVVSLFFSRLYG